MDKRIEANLLVKKKITDAFFKLLEEKKDIHEISVSELIETADVARSSFYRNYGSITAILDAYVSQLIAEFSEENPIKRVDFKNFEYMRFVFTFYYERRERVLCMYNSGLSSMILKGISEYHIDNLGDMPSNSIKRYFLYYFTGAIYVVVIHWLISGTKESIDDMARYFCELAASSSGKNLI